VLLGDSGTGKSHLLIGLGLAACEQDRRVRYVTTAHLVNELVEAADERVLSRVVAKYGRLDLLCLDLCRHRDYPDQGGISAAGLGVFVVVVGIVTGSRGRRAPCRWGGNAQAWSLLGLSGRALSL